ncbi:MAG TPA: InlB B-repeat-containing protein [Bacilli bacterium]|nr:InlB B-repeat-containing protein [Bacilli bacterium]
MKNGYTFAGWFLAGTAFDFNDPITDDITLIAKWN